VFRFLPAGYHEHPRFLIGAGGVAVVVEVAYRRGEWRASPLQGDHGGRKSLEHRARGSLDRHATYIVAAYVAGAAR